MFAGFAGIWHKSWISLELDSNTHRCLKYTEDFDLHHEVDLKKVKNLTLVREVKNLATPLSQNLPVLVVDCMDRSLYIQSPSQKEGLSLKASLEQVAFSNTNDLNDLQLTSEDIPVIVDKCIRYASLNFFFTMYKSVTYKSYILISQNAIFFQFCLRTRMHDRRHL